MFGTYRTLLALMVVALHLGGVPVIGAYAVFGFYIISGYLMTFIMHINYGYKLSGMAKYAMNRFLRIYPIYWISIGLSAILIIIIGEDFTSNYHSAIYLPKKNPDIINNILILFPNRISSRLTPPAWALTVELFFYILIGIGLSRNKKLVVGWLIISVIYHVVGFYLGFGWERRYFSISAASLPFATGAFIYHYNDKIQYLFKPIRGKLEDYFPYYIFAGIMLNWSIGYLSEHLRGLNFYVNYLLCAIMVACLSKRRSLPIISKRLDGWLGEFSYPIYLIHYQVGLVVVFLMQSVGLYIQRPDLTLMLVSIPWIFIISWILTAGLNRRIEAVRSRIKRLHAK